MTSLVQKIPVDSNRHEFVMTQNAWKRCCCITLLTWLVYFPPITLLLIVYWHTGDCKETFNVKSTKIAQTTQNIWNFIVGKSTLQEMAKFGDYPGDIILKPRDREIRSKIWCLPDYPGELTALLAGAGRNGKLQNGLFFLHFCAVFILLPLTVTRNFSSLQPFVKSHFLEYTLPRFFNL